ncbi:MAG: TIGR04133 family radical SAM/SPASM protein [Rikenellaceae bacterium]|nr:TIGR04133 family radical SAM/SPASM protein [Rikenellaceae bacterium]
MSAADISLRKRLALGLFNRQRAIEVKRHTLNYLMWECTLRCNLSCRHCGSDCHKDAAVPDMPMADFLGVVDRITPCVDPHSTMIVITGGEPLMRIDLERCGRELYERGFPWGMVTNGLALTRPRLESLWQAGLSSVTVSLDGIAGTHNELRGNPHSFDRALGAIRMLREKKEDIVYDVVTCVTPANFGQLDRIKELLLDAGCGRWRIFTVFPIGRAADSDLQLDPAQFREVFEYIKRTRREGRIKVDYGCEGFLGSYEADVRDQFFFCRAGINVASVLADGSISACPNLRSHYIQGNIYRDDFQEVWNSGFHPHRDRSWTKKGECQSCKYHKYFHGNGLHLRDEDGNLLFCHLNRIRQGEAI